MDRPIQHESNESGGSFYIEQDARRIASLTYQRAGAALIIVNHVGVDPAIEGQGVGRSLLHAVVQWARETQTKIHPTCSYAVALFRRDASIRDVLRNDQA